MIKYFLLFLWFVPFLMHSQKDTTDLDYSPFTNPVLKGTTVLSSSPKNVSAWNLGYYLENIRSSDCDNLESKPEQTHQITEVKWIGDTMQVSIRVNANCCYSFLGEIEITNDTLDLIYHGYGSLCGCTCCFGLTYSIYVMKNKDTTEVRQIMINGDRKTIKKTNK